DRERSGKTGGSRGARRCPRGHSGAGATPILGEGSLGIHALPTAIAANEVDDADSALRRELYFYTLYRLLEASMLVLVLFGPVADMIGPPRHDLLARAVALSYLFLAALLFLFGRRGELRGNALAGI